MTVEFRGKSQVTVRCTVHRTVSVIALLGYPERSIIYNYPPNDVCQDYAHGRVKHTKIQSDGLRKIRLDRKQSHDEEKYEHHDAKLQYKAMYLLHGPSFIRWAQPVFLVRKIGPLERKHKGEAMAKIKGTKQKHMGTCHKKGVDIIGCPAVCHPVGAKMDGHTRRQHGQRNQRHNHINNKHQNEERTHLSPSAKRSG
ncbi:MAG: hypothetical protein PHW60_11245 [Kiritimatiellae bacterium]|nr:hypothetical protein [Kiritimatiellia bacterium]